MGRSTSHFISLHPAVFHRAPSRSPPDSPLIPTIVSPFSRLISLSQASPHKVFMLYICYGYGQTPVIITCLYSFTCCHSPDVSSRIGFFIVPCKGQSFFSLCVTVYCLPACLPTWLRSTCLLVVFHITVPLVRGSDAPHWSGPQVEAFML